MIMFFKGFNDWGLGWGGGGTVRNKKNGVYSLHDFSYKKH